MILIRKENPVISTGKFETLANTNDSVFAFRRYDSKNEIIVILNLSDSFQRADVLYQGFNAKKKEIRLLNGTPVNVTFENKIPVFLPAYGIDIYQLKSKN